MSLNNLNTYQQPLISMAEMCLKRASIERQLKTAPGYIVRERVEQNRPRITYLDESGKPTTRADIANKYGVSYKCVSDTYARNEMNWTNTHKELGARL